MLNTAKLARASATTNAQGAATAQDRSQRFSVVVLASPRVHPCLQTHIVVPWSMCSSVSSSLPQTPLRDLVFRTSHKFSLQQQFHSLNLHSQPFLLPNRWSECKQAPRFSRRIRQLRRLWSCPPAATKSPALRTSRKYNHVTW